MPETILHILPGLRAGGAEQVLRMIVTNPRTRFNHRVISLGDHGQLGRRLEEAGVPVTTLGARGIADAPAALMRLWHACHTIPHALIHAWLYHGIAAATAFPFSRAPVIGAIHATHLEMNRLRLGTRAAISLAKRGFPACRELVFCSRSALEYHQSSGFKIEHYRIIENGVDTAVFDRDIMGRDDARRGLGLPLDKILIGMAARFDPQKDHSSLLAAVRQVKSSGVPLRLVLAGVGIDAENTELARLVQQHLEPDDVILLGFRNEMPEFFRALDIAVLSSSYGEAWPLSVGEAMAMACPVIATDVGDTATILRDTGSLVPPRSPGALADAIREVLEMPPEQLAPRLAAAHARIVEQYSSEAMLGKYEALYDRVLRDRS